jgi:uncharacterized integral membrane protein (TIGR00698 family)
MIRAVRGRCAYLAFTRCAAVAIPIPCIQALHWEHRGFSTEQSRRDAKDPSRGPSPLSAQKSTSTQLDDSKQAGKPSAHLPRPPSAADGSLFPGVAMSAATALGGFSIASALTTTLAVPLSGIPFSILLGLAIKNVVGYPTETFHPGIVFATKTILQGGIVCVAAKLSFWELITAGTTGIPVVLGSVGAGLLFIPWAGRVAGLPKEMSLLLTAGTSICGVTAITALAPAIHAQPRDIAVAVANTVAFGTLGMLTYPYVFHALCSSSEQVGLCLGVAIHDTSQVLGSALLYKETFADEVAFKVAAVTKLMRNLGLVVAIPLLTYRYHSSVSSETMSSESSKVQTMSGLSTFSKFVPSFLVAFVGMTAFRSGGDFLLQDFAGYTQIMDFVGNDLSKYALGTAMAGVGLSTSMSSLQNVGWKPFAVGLSGALVVGGTGFTIAMITA